MSRVAGWMAAGLLLAPAIGAQDRPGGAGFPHRRHEHLFPTCESCHAGIATGDVATSMPDESACRACHNGTDVRAVTWRRTARGAGLLRFSHPVHAAEVDSAGRACATCHAAPGGRRMDVRRPDPGSCLGCHTHQASGHLAVDNRCAACHVTLTQATGLSRDRVAALPKPPTHQGSGFAAAYRPASSLASSSCAVCHARESCARCHVNAATQPVIAALGRDARVASLTAGRAAVYPVPVDHGGGDFTESHGALARADAARCSACHARTSCATCHLGAGASEVLSRIPLPERGGATGVHLMLPPALRNRPALGGLVRLVDTVSAAAPRVVRVHEADFIARHGTRAAAGAGSCAGCHAQAFCSDCHAGENRNRYHPANFAVRHAADSYSREADCASCHNAELFCRSCHQASGLGSEGRLDAAYHNAQPLWLLQHGRAARQGLQSCTTCHAQRDCLTCHSTIGWGVNPHGPGFDAARLAARNPAQCLMCHLQVPRKP